MESISWLINRSGSIEKGADRQPGPEAEARVRELARFVERLRALGYRESSVGPFVVYAPPA